MQTFLAWLPRILGAIIWLIGQIQGKQAEVMQAAGVFSSAGEATETIAWWGNLETGGIVAFVVSFFIPKLTEWYGKWRIGKGAQQWDYALDTGALNTLKNITRVGIAADQPHINALIESGVQQETEQRLGMKSLPVAAEVV